MNGDQLVEHLALEAWAQRVALGIGRPETALAQSEALERVGSAVHRDLPHQMLSVVNDLRPWISKVAAWAIAVVRPEIVCITDHVAGIVAGMRVESPPDRAPSLLSGPFFVRSRCGADLSPGVRAIWGYEWAGGWYVNVANQREILAHRVRLDWSADTFDAAFADTSAHPDHPESGINWKYRDRVLPAFKWVVALGMLLDARGAPIESQDTTRTQALLRPREAKRGAGMRYRTVRVSKAGVHAIQRAAAAAGEAPDREGLIRRDVIVRGFLRRQACGPGMSERRWVYIEQHVGSRWVRDDETPRRTTVRAVEAPR